MLLLAPTELPSITIYLLGAVSPLPDRILSPLPILRLWRRAQEGRLKEARDKLNTLIQLIQHVGLKTF